MPTAVSWTAAAAAATATAAAATAAAAAAARRRFRELKLLLCDFSRRHAHLIKPILNQD